MIKQRLALLPLLEEKNTHINVPYEARAEWCLAESGVEGSFCKGAVGDELFFCWKKDAGGSNTGNTFRENNTVGVRPWRHGREESEDLGKDICRCSGACILTADSSRAEYKSARDGAVARFD